MPAGFPGMKHDSSAEGESQTMRAVLQIRELLIQGALEPGARIREVPLAQRLGVSRTPLRLALDRLAGEGLLERRARRGFVARQFSAQYILDAIDLRGVLEGVAASRAAERLTSLKEIEPLDACVLEGEALMQRKLPGVEMIQQYTAINTRFHAALLAMAKSSILTESMDRVRTLPFASPNGIVFSEAEDEARREKFMIPISQHAAIAEAIRNREAGRAEALAREHARIARRALVNAMREKRAASLPGGHLIEFPKAATAESDTSNSKTRGNDL